MTPRGIDFFVSMSQICNSHTK